MKKALMVFGGTFLVLMVLGVIGFTIVAIKGSALDKESKQYADSAIPAIISGWDINELQQRASPEFKAVMKDGDWEKLYAMFRRLGKLKAYNGCRGSSNMSLTSAQGKVVSAAYSGSADFETGPAEIRLSLIKHGGRWQILGFRINSRLFLDQQ
jgi:hypothetical protein